MYFKISKKLYGYDRTVLLLKYYWKTANYYKYIINKVKI